MADFEFSIIMAVYNRESMVSEAIRSVLDQTSSNWEFLICDDASTDQTVTQIASFLHDPRLTLTINRENVGAYVSRNRLLERARGKYIAFLDSDDYYFPQTLARVKAAFENDNYADILSTICEDPHNGVYDEEFSTKIRRQIFKKKQPPIGYDELNPMIMSKIKEDGGGSGVLLLCTTFFRAECFEFVRFRGKKRTAEDQGLFRDMAVAGFNFRPGNFLTYHYNIHGKNLHIKKAAVTRVAKGERPELLLVSLDPVNSEEILREGVIDKTRLVCLKDNPNLFRNLLNYGNAPLKINNADIR